MKKVITIAICICLVFSSITPAYAAETITYFMDGNTSTRISAYQAMQTIISYLTLITNQGISTQNFLTLDGDGNNPQTYRSFQDLALILDVIGEQFLYAQDVNPNYYSMVTWLYATCDKIVGDIYLDIASTASTVSSINTGLMSYRNSILTPRLNQIKTDLEKGLTNMPSFFEGPDNDGNYYLQSWNLDYTLSPDDESSQYSNFYWGSNTSKADVIIAQLQYMTNNQYALDRWLLTDFDSTLSIWDSQGDSLTQSTWTPSSAMNGLYKYLAFTQRDIARLTHVLASDYEIEARDNVQDLQESFNDQFLDPSSDGAISTNDVEDISGLSGGIKQNISTDANASGIFDIFNSDHGGWFSQQTANELDTSTQQNRGDNNANSTYPTPLLDERIYEIYNALGVNDND